MGLVDLAIQPSRYDDTISRLATRYRTVDAAWCVARFKQQGAVNPRRLSLLGGFRRSRFQPRLQHFHYQFLTEICWVFVAITHRMTLPSSSYAF